MEDTSPLSSDAGPYIYREDDMVQRLTPEQFAYYRSLPVADQVMLAVFVHNGHDFKRAITLASLESKG
ncbi:MAG TPA: hypothetical protein VEY71_03630 [Chitinophagales bacterium]|nr:hypothetical protein [Chitinophagales bacterium]